MLISAIDSRFNPFNVFDFGLTGVFLFIDSIVYWLVAQLFKLFVAVAGVSLPVDVYQKIASNMEVIIGVFALFYLAYALLKALVNPDDLQKQTPKIVGNLVISLVLLGVTPMVFDYAMKLQNLIISKNIIGNRIYGTNTSTDIESAGYALAFSALETFLTVPDKVEGTNILYTDDFGEEQNLTWGLLKVSIIKNKRIENFRAITQWVEPIHSRTLGCDYVPIVSTICGCVLIYVIFSFCLDMGLRVAKMAFYRIISPIPILMRIIPSKKSVFDTWLKESLGTFLEVFIRLFIIQIGIFLVDVIINSNVLEFNQTAGKIGLFGNMIIILGIMAFIKVAPKKISEMLGIKGDFKIGIGGKLQASGAYGLAAMAGGGLTTGIRNMFHGVNNIKDAKGLGKFAAAGRGLLSIASGTLSGAARSAKGGFSAKNINDMRNAAGRGAQAATTARDNREAYKASHGNNWAGVAAGHISDMFTSSVEWAQGGFEAEERRIKYYNEVLAAQDKAKAEAEKLREKNSNNATLMEEAYTHTDWKGNAKDVFDSLRDVHGNAMSLDAIRSYIDSYSKRDTTGMSVDDLRDFSKQVADYKNMLNQLEKGAWQTIESAAFDSSLMTTLGLNNEKLSGVRKEVDNMNNMRQSAGESAITPNSADALQDFNDTLTDIETKRNNATAELERKKREREARQQNSNNNNH